MEQRVEFLEGRMEAARSFEKRQMRGDMKRQIIALVKAAQKNPAPEFKPVLSEAASLLAKNKFYSPASEAYEVMGDYTRAIEYAELSGDLERSKTLLAHMAEKSPTETSEMADARAQLGLSLLEKAEEMYRREKGAGHLRMGNPATQTLKELTKAEKELQGLPLAEADYRRLLSLQMNARPKERIDTAKAAEWLRPPGLNPQEYGLRKVRLWHEMARAHRNTPKLATVFRTKAISASESDELKTKLSETDARYLRELKAEVAYITGDYKTALELAKELFPDNQRALDLYKFAATSQMDTIRKNPYPFAEPKPATAAQTRVYLFSPSRTYLEKGFEETAQSPQNKFEWTPEKEKTGFKVTFKADSGYLYLLSLGSGFRYPFKADFYPEVSQTGVSKAEPHISFAGESNFKYGQFKIYEVEWNGPELSKIAVDFIGSATGDLNDVCYGQLRYNSKYQ